MSWSFAPVVSEIVNFVAAPVQFKDYAKYLSILSRRCCKVRSLFRQNKLRPLAVTHVNVCECQTLRKGDFQSCFDLRVGKIRSHIQTLPFNASV